MARALSRMNACCCRPSSSSSSSIGSNRSNSLAAANEQQAIAETRSSIINSSPANQSRQEGANQRGAGCKLSLAGGDVATNAKSAATAAGAKQEASKTGSWAKKHSLRKGSSLSTGQDNDSTMTQNSSAGRQSCHCLDLSHEKLSEVSPALFAQVTDKSKIEELNLESNNIQELPRQLFNQFKNLKRLHLSDNDIRAVPSHISHLQQLELLFMSKNQLGFISDEIRRCRQLTSLELSVNPLNKLTDSIFQLAKLQELYLNDIFLEHLPASIGKLAELRVLELRENDLKTLPKSMARLSKLRCLDLGQNDLAHVPEVLGHLIGLEELWLDANHIKYLAEFLGRLKRLKYFDCSKNQIAHIDPQFFKCFELKDLIMSQNNLQHLPATICDLCELQTLKLEDNELVDLPNDLGKLSQLEELVISNNRIQALPNSIGQLTNLKILLTDVNALVRLPQSIGQCSSLRILNVASNNLLSLPDEIGRLDDLRVLNLANNYLRYLPKTIAQLSKLTALWLNDNQKKPLILLQVEHDEKNQNQVLTCFLFPQTGPIFGPVSPAAAATLLAQQQQQLQHLPNQPAANVQPVQQIAIGVQKHQQPHLNGQLNGPLVQVNSRKQQPVYQPVTQAALPAHSALQLSAEQHPVGAAAAESRSVDRVQQYANSTAAGAGPQSPIRRMHRLSEAGSFGLMDDEDEEVLQMSNTLDKSAAFGSLANMRASAMAKANSDASVKPIALLEVEEVKTTLDCEMAAMSGSPVAVSITNNLAG